MATSRKTAAAADVAAPCPAAAAPAAAPMPLPRKGGAYTRMPDGSLRCDEQADDSAPPAADPAATQE